MKSIAERQAERKASLEKRWKELFEAINLMYADLQKLKNEKLEIEKARQKIVLAETKIKLKKLGKEKKPEKNNFIGLLTSGPKSMAEYGWYDADIEAKIQMNQNVWGIDRDAAIIKTFEAM